MSCRRARLIGLLSFFAASVASAQSSTEGRLMRFPDIYKDRVVFSYGGDLWLVSTEGGAANRVTSHPGLELFPKFSPDGKWIAFTGQYDGNFNVYVMPSTGGQPKQLTFLPDVERAPERFGPNNQVITWTNDSKRIVFLSRRNTFNSWFGRLFSVSIDGGLPEQLPIDKGGLTSFSPTGEQIAFNRIFRNFRTWKRYKGGLAQDIWIYDFKANHLEQMTDYEGTDTFPMWHGDTIYFTSDRGAGQRMNIYAYDLKTKTTRQVTSYTDFDVSWPSLGPDSIIFEKGGFLHLLDLESQAAHKLTVSLPGDNDQVRKHWTNVAGLTTDFDIAPDGQRAVLSARGDVFTVPAKYGSIRNLTRSPGARDKAGTWSPDGKLIAYVSDQSGEDELYVVAPDGTGEPRAVTVGHKGFLFQPVWSPDNTKLLYADYAAHLWYVDIHGKKPVAIDQTRYGDLTYYVWSPDSRFVAYAKPEENRYQTVSLYSLAEHKISPVTTSFNDSWNPIFDPEGKYLYFLSNRSYNEVIGVYDMEFANPKATRVYVVTLRADTPSPFAPRSDEAGAKPEDKSKPEDKDKDKKKPVPEVKVDLDGIGNRVVALPIPAGNLSQLAAGKGLVFYLSQPIQGLSGPVAGESPAIHGFDFKERKDSVVAAGPTSFVLSFEGTRILYCAPKHGDGGGAEEQEGPSDRIFGLIDAKIPDKDAAKVGDGALKLEDLMMEVDPRAEWMQMFNETWRQQRDFFFEAAMNGVDWVAEKKRYEPLAAAAASRYDLTYVLGEMVGELANSHTYVGGGDGPDLKTVNVGVLGVDFELDSAAGMYRIKKIYHGENWNDVLRSPLTEPGVNAHEGQYLLAVNGRPVRPPQNPYEPFVNTNGKNVTLTLNDKPRDKGAATVTIRPIGSELPLRELDWIETNRKKVDQLSGGKIGYVYLPDMGGAGLNELVKQYFPQLRKQGLIFDVRYNGGGFVDQLIFARLRRILAGMGSARLWESNTYPDNVFYGHMACVTNEYAASDGDMFTHFFKQYKLGPVVGMRTWGGVRGIRGYIPLMDGGYMTRPEFSLYGLDSKWLIENHGVEPDVVVDNRTDLVVKGADPQLEKAVELVLLEIETHPKKLPARPPDLPAYPPAKQ